MSLVIKEIVKISFTAINNLRLLYVFKTGLLVMRITINFFFLKKSNQNNKNLI